MKPMTALIFLLSLAASPVQIWSTPDLKTASDRLANEPDAKTIAGKTLGAYGNQSASLWRRANSGQAELHKTKVDLIVIQQGSATLVTGGTIPEPHATQPNEVRGSAIRGGERAKSSPATSSAFRPIRRISSCSTPGRRWPTSRSR